jgi:hypothetical protein
MVLVGEGRRVMAENPGWRADPLGSHEERYFNRRGAATPIVRNDGIETIENWEYADGSGTHSSDQPVQPQPTEDFVAGLAIAHTPDIFTGSTDLEGHAATPRRVEHYDSTTQEIAPLVTASPVAAIPDAQPPVTAKRKRKPLAIAAAIFLVFLLIGTGVLAYQQHTVANKWMHDDQQEVHQNAALSSQNSSLSSKNSSLSGQVSGLQTQLSAVADQKAKALDQNAVLTTALQDATGVANDLNTCVNDTSVVLTDVSNALSLGFVTAADESDATTTGQVCSKAQSEEAALQQALSGG